jgi:hypothetical protein
MAAPINATPSRKELKMYAWISMGSMFTLMFVYVAFVLWAESDRERETVTEPSKRRHDARQGAGMAILSPARTRQCACHAGTSEVGLRC